MSQSIDRLPEPAGEAELFADFANTLEYERGEAVDHVATTDALLAWLHAHGLISDRARATEVQRLARDHAEGARRLERFAFLRALLREVSERVTAGERPTRDEVRQLNHVLRHGLHYHQLLPEPDGARYSVAQVGDRLDQARATIATSLAHFLAEDEPSRLRICANDACRYVFIDRSPTGRRRWCDMRTCGNQAKVARHRARARSAKASRGDAPALE
jgi:predicted RNA-binding Zn ribbon-like protein